ncbi:DUF1761 family protein [Mangrovibacterium diazotrophicum]|uniref:Uncharacterized protein DUF1761 n=1 Tax=Mangrovibacterium diazotrophicum TaxID=1261403 RepID=A0A419W969_9BACT|nr:DUF1761 family protein [Mangrovibacterium diazotrophicum]RKD92018.1 uncharacterized protein DUF1761 [Mangrovibacterium diazotrophicum]
MTKKLLLSGLAGGVVFFLLGWVFYGMLFGEFFANNAGSATGVYKSDEEMNLLLLFLGNLASGYLLAFIFGCWGTVKSALDGTSKGFIIGILIGLGFDFVMYSTSNLMNFTAVIVDIIIYGVMTAVAGAVVGGILSNSKKSKQA